jgi:hypothetical protein
VTNTVVHTTCGELRILEHDGMVRVEVADAVSGCSGIAA